MSIDQVVQKPDGEFVGNEVIWKYAVFLDDHQSI
jgi:hypothetical protein